MNRMQKIAWFNLAVIMIGFLILMLAVVCKIPKVGGMIILIVATVALTAGPSVFFRKKQGKIDFDERDAMIREKSLLIGFAAAFGSLGGVYISQLLRLGFDGSVRISDVFFMYIGALISFVIVKSLVVLGAYGWKEKTNE